MLAIQRTEEGQLRLADRRRSGVAAGEAEARRTLYHWGYTDLSINKALAEMRQAEGSLPPATPWRVIRPTDRAHETSAGATAPESPAPAPEASAKKPARRRRGTTAPDAEPASATAPAAPEAAPDPEPSPAPKKRKRRPAGKAESPAPTAAADAPVAQDPEEEKPARTRRSRSRKKSAASPPPPEADAADAAAPVAEAPKPRRPRKPKAAPKEDPPAAEPEAPPARKRSSRKRTAPAGPTAAAASPDAGPDPLARALELFADGARALREIEESTLPFARGPWTELRTQAEHILTCLKGK